MRKYIALISVVLALTLVVMAGNSIWVEHATKGANSKITATVTDTTKAVSLEYAKNAQLNVYVDEKGSSTFTVEIDILGERNDGTWFLIKDTTALITAGTADAFARLNLRDALDKVDLYDVGTNSIKFRRVITLTGDSVYVSHKLDTW
jgi:hypothetical protein